MITKTIKNFDNLDKVLPNTKYTNCTFAIGAIALDNNHFSNCRFLKECAIIRAQKSSFNNCKFNHLVIKHCAKKARTDLKFHNTECDFLALYESRLAQFTQWFHGNTSVKMMFIAGMKDTCENMLKSYKGIKNLKWLSVDTLYNKIDDQGLKHLTVHKKLAELKLSNSLVTGTGVNALSKLPLTTLDLNGSKISLDGAKVIASLKHLKALHLSNCGITEAHIKCLAGATGLEMLWAAWNEIKSFDGFEKLKALKSVSLLNNPLGNSLAPLSELSRLVKLEMIDSGITDEAFSGCTLPSGLKTLLLDDCKGFSGKNFSDVGPLKRLEALSLMGTMVDDHFIKLLSERSSLKTLQFYNTKITGEGLGYLNEMTNLEHLYAACTDLTNLKENALSGLVNLKSFTISNDNASPYQIGYFGIPKQLTTLALNDKEITEEHFKGLERYQLLNELTLSCYNGSSELTASMASKIQKLTNLSQLCFENMTAKPKNLLFVKNLKKLTWLRIPKTQLTEELLEAVSRLQELKTFSAQNCQSNSALSFLSPLKRCQQLTELRLGAGHDADEIKAIAAALPNLEYLSFNDKVFYNSADISAYGLSQSYNE